MKTWNSNVTGFEDILLWQMNLPQKMNKIYLHVFISLAILQRQIFFNYHYDVAYKTYHQKLDTPNWTITMETSSKSIMTYILVILAFIWSNIQGIWQNEHVDVQYVAVTLQHDLVIVTQSHTINILKMKSWWVHHWFGGFTSIMVNMSGCTHPKKDHPGARHIVVPSWMLAVKKVVHVGWCLCTCEFVCIVNFHFLQISFFPISTLCILGDQ